MEKVMYEDVAKMGNAGLERYDPSIKAGVLQAGIIIPFGSKKSDVSDDKSKQDINTLDKENLQLFFSDTYASNKNFKNPKVDATHS